MPGNKSLTAPNLWMQSARTKGRQPTPATTAMVTHHLYSPRTVPTAPSWQSKLPSMWFPLFQNATKWDIGDPNAMVASYSNQGMHPHLGPQQRKSRCPPRNHNHHQGWKNKTDTIDVRGDHSPQGEIALHYIQPSTTVRHAHPEEIMVGDIHAPQCNEGYTTIQLPASASRKGTASLHVKVNTGAGGNVLPLHVFWCLYPDQISPAGLPTGLDHVNTRLTAYNGIPYTSIWCTPRTHHLAARLPWCSPHRVKSYWVHCGHPGPAILGIPSSEKLAVVKDELCHHHQMTHHTSCTCFHYSGHKQACYSPWCSQAHQVHWWLDQRVSRSVQGNWQISRWIQNPTPSWCTSCDTCPQEMPHCLMSKGQGAPQ